MGRTRTLSSLLGVLAAALAACAVAPPPTPRATPAKVVARAPIGPAATPEPSTATADPAPRRQAPKRPAFPAFDALDYAALPLAEEGRISLSDVYTSFWFYDDTPPRRRYSYYDFGSEETWRISRKWPNQVVITIGGYVLPSTYSDGRLSSTENVKRITEDRYVGRTLVHVPVKQDASWASIDGKNRTEEFVDVAFYEGVFAARLVQATKVSRVRAKAILPGKLYAFRRCVDHCDEPLDGEHRREELMVVGPPAVWVGTSGETSNAALAFDPVFTMARASIEPGSSASLLFDVSNKYLAADDDPSGTTSFDIDVLWPSGGEPSVSMFSGYVLGKKEALQPAGLDQIRSRDRF